MDQASYLNIILAKYAGTFDIEKNRVIDGREYTAYGYFSSLGEKYVLVKKAKLWSVKAYEHAFFLTEDESVHGYLRSCKLHSRIILELSQLIITISFQLDKYGAV